MKIVNKNSKDGKLLSITCLIEAPTEKEAFRKLPCFQKCPHCGKPVNPKDEQLFLVVPTPLTQSIPGSGIDLGIAGTKCSSCGEDVVDADQCDIMSFPEVRAYVTKLRRAYEAQVAAARAKKGGSSSGKKG